MRESFHYPISLSLILEELARLKIDIPIGDVEFDQLRIPCSINVVL